MYRTNNIAVYIDDGVNAMTLLAQKGELLLDVLRRSGKPISAPCGGKGTCGKCSVIINDSDSVLACSWHLHQNTRVFLAGQQQFAILEKTGSHMFLKQGSVGQALHFTCRGNHHIIELSL